MRLASAFLLAAALPLAGQDLVVKEDPLSPREQAKRFHLPPGFEIQLVASEPDIAKPMNLAFDDRGRLLVTSSYEYPFPAKPGVPGRDAVRILEDFAPDGRARKVSTFAGDLNIPIGVTATSEGALTHSIPKVWRLVDADGDGKADSREELFGDVGLRDTHGMVNAFTPWVDGWIYACHGFANDSTIRSAKTGASIRMVSGNTWRFKADGGAIEHYTRGQVNPFGLSFDPLGNLYSADCHSLPIYALLRGGNYPTFDGKHDGLGHAPSIMKHLHGSTAIGGIVYYAADHFPPGYRETIFVGNPVTGRVNHDRLEPHGSSWKALEQPDFLRCDDKWFRPVDLKLAPDGSLYIADFYNRIIGHYEVPLTHPGRDRERGRIWRVVWKGEGAAPPRPMPDLSRASDEMLAGLLKDPNLGVRVRAVNRLAERRAGAVAQDAMDAEPSAPFLQAYGLWVLDRGGLLSEDRVRRLLRHDDRLVRVHLLKALAERRVWTFEAPLVRAALQDADAYVRRAAAEALGLHPDFENVGPLLELWSAAPAEDTHLVHMVRMALRDQIASEPVAKLCAGIAEPAARRRLASVAVGAPTEEAAKLVLEVARAQGVEAGSLRHLIRHLSAERLPEAFGLALGSAFPSSRERLGLVRAAVQACQERGVAVPEDVQAWAGKAAAAAIGGSSKTDLQEGLKLARELKWGPLYDAVERLALSDGPEDSRSAAIDALPSLNRDRAAQALVPLAARASSAAIRLKAAGALASIPTSEARRGLVDLLQGSPHGTGVLIAAGLAGTREGASLLLEAASAGKASPRLLLDVNVQNRLRSVKDEALVRRLEGLVKDLPPEDARVSALIKARKEGYEKSKGDAARGLEVYRKTCAACHQIDGLGEKVGPELDAVYTRGAERLLEDVLDPNRNVDQAFRATLIKTVDGRVISGLVKREEGAVIVVQETADRETRLEKKDIEARQLSSLSPMPSNVADPLSEQDLYDLLAFLLRPRGQK
jgi:putative heme-binding domain-containing protein